MKIRADRHDTHDQDLADAIEQALNRNGENTPSTNIGWGNHKITNLGDGNSADDAATVGQVQSQVVGVAKASGTDALTASFSPAITAFTDKTTLYVRAAAANTSTTPTLKPNALAAKTITKEGNQALVAGDIAGAEHVLILQYIESNDVWELLNPARIGQVTATDEELNTSAFFPSIDADVTATEDDLNKTDGITGQILTSGNDGPVYTGWVDVSVPEIVNGPSGWSVSKVGPGSYTINHSLNLSDIKNLIGLDSVAIDQPAITRYKMDGTSTSDSNNANILVLRVSDGSNIDSDFQFAFLNTEEA